jgi:hypothetical protein
MNKLEQVAFYLSFLFFSIGVIIFFINWFATNDDSGYNEFFILGVVCLLIFLLSDDIVELIMNIIHKYIKTK